VVYIIDSRQVGSLEDFWRVMGEAVNGPDGYFGDNLGAFNDFVFASLKGELIDRQAWPTRAMARRVIAWFRGTGCAAPSAARHPPNSKKTTRSRR